ncbi:MAG TPA: DUF488 domain-containing protein [Ignavibacteriaceae bacterium]|nr:DUF488 domain-containing protein [Ignavibacteriaceae bacterium]
MEKTIWTIGHSTRSIEEFIEILNSFSIELLVDVRSYPGSRRYPQFNIENLSVSLPENGIRYLHMKNLGGRRKPDKNSVNTGWKNDAFKGYADYMETDGFKEGIDKLTDLALREKTSIMCAEALWWRCHRSLISDYLKFKGWSVFHITAKDKAEEHPFTKPARINRGRLFYND